MSDLSYRLMVALFKLGDAVYPTVARRTRGFGIKPGMTVVDYGCGPGRYTIRFARLVGEIGRVYDWVVGLFALPEESEKIRR